MAYDDLELLLLVALLALLTLVARNFFLVLPSRWQPRGAVAEALRYAPLAALLAITVPEIARDLPVGAAGATAAWADAPTDPRLASALVLAAVIGLTRNALWGLVAGTVAYIALLRLTGYGA
jgi:branched-subunit amino acid transport protein